MQLKSRTICKFYLLWINHLDDIFAYNHDSKVSQFKFLCFIDAGIKQ